MDWTWTGAFAAHLAGLAVAVGHWRWAQQDRLQSDVNRLQASGEDQAALH